MFVVIVGKNDLKIILKIFVVYIKEEMSQVQEMPQKMSWFQTHKNDADFIARHNYNSVRSYYVRLFKTKRDMYYKSIRRLAIEDEELSNKINEFVVKKYG